MRSRVPGELADHLPRRYQIREVLSEGELGGSYLVHDSGLRSARAVLKWQLLAAHDGDTRTEAEFLEHAATLRELRHPGICRSYAHGVLENAESMRIGYMVREFVAGTALSELVAPFVSPAAIQVGIQVASALKALHVRSLLCGDLKPANLIVQRASKSSIDPLSQLVIIDLTWRSTQRAQDATLLDMTLQYAAPEVMAGAAPDARADLFSLGVLLYWCITGHLPFEGESLSEILRQQRTRSYTPSNRSGPSQSDFAARVTSRARSRSLETWERTADARGAPSSSVGWS